MSEQVMFKQFKEINIMALQELEWGICKKVITLGSKIEYQ